MIRGATWRWRMQESARKIRYLVRRVRVLESKRVVARRVILGTLAGQARSDWEGVGASRVCA
jgi:hypothetical protein